MAEEREGKAALTRLSTEMFSFLPLFLFVVVDSLASTAASLSREKLSAPLFSHVMRSAIGQDEERHASASGERERVCAREGNEEAKDDRRGRLGAGER